MNPVISALAQREQYLFEQLNIAAAEAMLVSADQPFSGNLNSGAPVYFNTTGTPVLNLAYASFNQSTNNGHLFPAPSSYVFGIVKKTYGGSGTGYYGDVYVRGLITDNSINYQTLLDSQSTANLSGGTLQPGPLYLSTTAGCLSTSPNGVGIFVGYYLGGTSFVLAPNIDSLNQLYFNYQMYLMNSTTGFTTSSGSPLVWTITDNTSSINNLGWMSASNAASVLGTAIPGISGVSAAYYYNIPTNTQISLLLANGTITTLQAQAANLLKIALPSQPSSYTLLFVNGVLQSQIDTDHPNGSYLINNNGIWWFKNIDGQTPFQSSSPAPTIELFITKINPNYAASIVTSLTSTTPVITLTNSVGASSTTGDLNLNFNLPITLSTASPGNGSTIQSVSSTSTGLLATTAGVVNKIVAGPGLSVTQTAGQATITLSNYALNGEVTDLDPIEADYVRKGLNSYLRLKKTQANQSIGFVGRLLLPSQIPANQNLQLSLLGFTEGSLNSASVNFNFQYACTNQNSSISTATSSSSASISGNSFLSWAQNTISADSSGNPYFIIPSTAFSAGSYINFNISRVSDTNANTIGILGVLWSLV
jgi:hypothetical protein